MVIITLTFRFPAGGNLNTADWRDCGRDAYNGITDMVLGACYTTHDHGRRKHRREWNQWLRLKYWSTEEN